MFGTIHSQRDYLPDGAPPPEPPRAVGHGSVRETLIAQSGSLVCLKTVSWRIDRPGCSARFKATRAMTVKSSTVILTVEDEGFLSLYLDELLQLNGYTVIGTGNADQAIKILESRHDIQIVITDISMPGSMDGLDLAAAVSDRWPPIKIIITTGFARPAANKMPPDSIFVPKPYDAKTITAAVERLL
jgi:two-component system, response regulator PdtaR